MFRNALNNQDLLQSITNVESFTNELYLVQFQDDSSVGLYFSEGNVYIMSRDYKTIDDVAARVGVLQVNLIWNQILQLRQSQVKRAY